MCDMNGSKLSLGDKIRFSSSAEGEGEGFVKAIYKEDDLWYCDIEDVFYLRYYSVEIVA